MMQLKLLNSKYRMIFMILLFGCNRDCDNFLTVKNDEIVFFGIANPLIFDGNISQLSSSSGKIFYKNENLWWIPNKESFLIKESGVFFPQYDTIYFQGKIFTDDYFNIIFEEYNLPPNFKFNGLKIKYSENVNYLMSDSIVKIIGYDASMIFSNKDSIVYLSGKPFEVNKEINKIIEDDFKLLKSINITKVHLKCNSWENKVDSIYPELQLSLNIE